MFRSRHAGRQRPQRIPKADGRLHNCRLHREPQKPQLGVRAGSPSPMLVFGKPAMCCIVMQIIGPRQRHQYVNVKQRYRHWSSGRKRIQEIPPMRPILVVERRPYVLWTELRLGIGHRKDTEPVPLSQRRMRNSALASEPRYRLSYRYPARLGQGSCQVEDIRFNIESGSHLDVMMTYYSFDVNLTDLAMRGSSVTRELTVHIRLAFVFITVPCGDAPEMDSSVSTDCPTNFAN